MRKTMSLKQLAANRQNARKSTGPRTPAGRAVSKMNALKHGILSKEVLVRGLNIKESSRELSALHERFWQELNPVGPVEEMLVDQIVTTHWRLRRALTAESGEIALNVDEGWWRRENDNPLPILLALPPLPGTEGLVTKLERSVWGCRYLIHCLTAVRQAVERDGELTEAVLTDFKKWLREQAHDLGDKLQQFRAWLVTNPEKLEPEALRVRHKEEVLKYLARNIRDLEFLLERREQREDAEEAARQAAAVLPSMEVLEKILRYETKLERQLFRAMAQLERLQRMRRGESVPAPLTVEVSERA
jgi:hypothetical protein